MFLHITLWHNTMELIARRHIDDTVCPVARTAEIIGGKWTLLIIRDLTSGVKRFNQLERSLQGISPKALSERLRSLQQYPPIDRPDHRDWRCRSASELEAGRRY